MNITVTAATAREFAEFVTIRGFAYLDVHPDGSTEARAGQMDGERMGHTNCWWVGEWDQRSLYLFFNGKSLHSFTEHDYETLARHLTEGANAEYPMRYEGEKLYPKHPAGALTSAQGVHSPPPLRRCASRLLFVPLAILGAALLVRARLPRPQTEGDKWLWEQAESVVSVDVVPNPLVAVWSKWRNRGGKGYPPSAAFGGEAVCWHIVIREREGIRTLLRAFQDVPRFEPTSKPVGLTWGAIDMHILFSTKSGHSRAGRGGCALRLYGGEGNYYLWRSDGTQAPLDAASAQRFQGALRAAINKARQHQHGYSTLRESYADLT